MLVPQSEVLQTLVPSITDNSLSMHLKEKALLGTQGF